jgi:peroxiredoxin
MATLIPPTCEFGRAAIDFRLKGTDGAWHTLAAARGPRGILVMFICNHCPYVKSALDKIIRDTAELKTHGIGSIAIMSNDPNAYPEDSPECMARIAQQKGFGFPYVLDETQEIAKAYGAVCTPDFFGYNAKLELQYRGRLDSSGHTADPKAPRELFNAMAQIARTGEGPREQVSAMGCSIKWRGRD